MYDPHAVMFMAEALEFLFLGAILGLVQGVSPGPLVALVISETLKFGVREGFKVAVSPLITDSTVIVLTLVVLSNFARYDVIISVVSISGACYLIYLGLENLRVKTPMLEAKVVKKEAFKRAVITNFLNPHVYVFWISVGGPTILRSLTTHASGPSLFLVGFYVLLIVNRSKALVKGNYYAHLVRALGIVLILFALVLLIEGWELLGSL